MEVDLKKLLPDSELSNCCSAALLNLLPEELGPALAELALGSLEELSYIPLPSEPYELSEFKNNIADGGEDRWDKKSVTEKDSISKKVYSNPNVSKYLEELGKIQPKNLSNVLTLERYIKIWLEWDEKDKARMCWVVYSKYPDSLEYANTVVWRKKKTFV